MVEPFAVRDCALISIATGERAQNLRELRDRLATTHPGCIYYHFWGRQLRPRFDDPEYQNDFAAWAGHDLHDKLLAERLAIIDPKDYKDIEELRRELIDIIEERLDEVEYVPWAKAGHYYFFVRSQIVVFDTGVRLTVPEELIEIVPKMSVSSIFYHFIDARRRTVSGKDDFREWLDGIEGTYGELTGRIALIDPYFNALSDLRDQLTKIVWDHFTEGV